MRSLIKKIILNLFLFSIYFLSHPSFAETNSSLKRSFVQKMISTCRSLFKPIQEIKIEFKNFETLESAAKKNMPQAVDELYELVVQKNPSAQRAWADMLWDGLGGLKKDREQAIRLYRESARGENHLAQIRLGYIARHSKRIKLLERVAKHTNDRHIMRVLGRVYYRGSWQIAPNYQKALYWYEKAALLHNKRSMYYAGKIYHEHYQNTEKAIEWFALAFQHGSKQAKHQLIEFAKAGHVTAMHALATALWNGTTQDTESALEWYSLAIKNGHHESLERLVEISNNSPIALKVLFRLLDTPHPLNNNLNALIEGYPNVMFDLAEMIEKEHSLEVNQNTAFDLHIRAAKQGHQSAIHKITEEAENNNVLAQVALADMFWKGEGVVQDENMSVKWYRRAARQGNPYAKNKLKFRSANLKHINKLQNKIKRKNDPSSMRELAEIFREGRAVPRNESKAESLLLLARTFSEVNDRAEDLGNDHSLSTTDETITENFENGHLLPMTDETTTESLENDRWLSETR